MAIDKTTKLQVAAANRNRLHNHTARRIVHRAVELTGLGPTKMVFDFIRDNISRFPADVQPKLLAACARRWKEINSVDND